AQKIVLMFDSDQAGYKASNRAIELFYGQSVEVELLSVPAGKDPCDFLQENDGDAFRELLKTAVSAIDYKWHSLLNEYEKQDAVNGRVKAIEEFLKIIGQMSRHGNLDPIKEGLIINRVAALLKQPAQLIHRQMMKVNLSQYEDKSNEEREQKGIKLGPLDAVNRSFQHIIEVLLNRPDLYCIVKEQTNNFSELSHPVLKQIAELIQKVCENTEKPSLAGMLGICQSLELCSLITDLAHTGELRGNYEKTLDGAIESLSANTEKKHREKLRNMITDSGSDFDRDTMDVMLADLQARLVKKKTESK
ncbi:MAG: toprim domain-containing protein, partial [Sedimentisphaerales bacterium]|nr:toprim domain-containing protein [Sedimentisphaerales bacterium]